MRVSVRGSRRGRRAGGRGLFSERCATCDRRAADVCFSRGSADAARAGASYNVALLPRAAASNKERRARRSRAGLRGSLGSCRGVTVARCCCCSSIPVAVRDGWRTGIVQPVPPVPRLRRATSAARCGVRAETYSIVLLSRKKAAAQPRVCRMRHAHAWASARRARIAIALIDIPGRSGAAAVRGSPRRRDRANSGAQDRLLLRARAGAAGCGAALQHTSRPACLRLCGAAVEAPQARRRCDDADAGRRRAGGGWLVIPLPPYRQRGRRQR